MSLLIASSRLKSFVLIERYIVSSALSKISLRTLLSSQYSCDSDWNKRLDKDDTLKHVSIERYFFELNKKYQQKQQVPAIDVDIFVNSLCRPEFQIELEHIIKKFRQTPKTVETLDSTHHAVCRFYLSNDQRNRLIQILNNRIEFGVFPDHYSYNILLDQCIKAKEWDQAFDVVKLMMLQEDSGNEITKTLALYIMNQLLIDEKVGPTESLVEDKKSIEETEPDVPDEDEIEYIRVPYLTNPYFDDHFDLVNREHIFGKSMYFFGRELEKSQSSISNENDRTLANAFMIIGLIFYQKWNRLKKVLDRLSSSEKFPLTSEPYEIVQKHLEIFKSSETIENELKHIKSRLENFSILVSATTLSDLISKRIENLPKLELIDIKSMHEMFDQFQNDRRRILNQQMDKVVQEQRLQEIEQRKKELEQKKRLYYFFENFPKHEIDFVEAEKRIKEIRSKNFVEEDYVPPEA